nr:hypothetical protein [Kofleriaceae bacterium]
MGRIPHAVARYPDQPAGPNPQRMQAARRIAACLAVGVVWLVLLAVAHDQVVRSMFVVKLLAAPFAFVFVVAAVELPRLLLGRSFGELARSWDTFTGPQRFLAGVFVVACALIFLAVSAGIAIAFLA